MKFHKSMIDSIMQDLSEDEAVVLNKPLTVWKHFSDSGQINIKKLRLINAAFFIHERVYCGTSLMPL